MVLAHAHVLDTGNISEIKMSKKVSFGESRTRRGIPNLQLVFQGKLGVTKVLMDGYAAIAVRAKNWGHVRVTICPGPRASGTQSRNSQQAEKNDTRSPRQLCRL